VNAVYDGFKREDTETVLDTPPTLTTYYLKGDALGEYPIFASGARANGNYSIVYEEGAIDVKSVVEDVNDNKPPSAGDSASPQPSAQPPATVKPPETAPPPETTQPPIEVPSATAPSVPDPPPAVETPSIEEEIIIDESPPLATPPLLNANLWFTKPFEASPNWSLINLILALLSLLGLLAVGLNILKHRRNDTSVYVDEEGVKVKEAPPGDRDRHRGLKFLSLLAGALAVVAFIVVENLHQRMTLINDLTPLIFVLSALQAMLLARIRGNREEGKHILLTDES
jgi:hypothetical protein